ncbi:MAG: hypothetical protein KIT22_06200, partial [Verrucomicrobiae bacterium]|nr:hypothetical protein [Verrucomicrobiae bacterium]
VSELDPGRHTQLLESLTRRTDKAFDLRDIEVAIPGRPRPILAKAALSREGDAAVLVDIPTTLAVIADFADFLAREGNDAGSGDEFVAEARKTMVASSESHRFQEVLEEFVDVVNQVGSLESRRQSPARLVHIVPLRRLKRRLDELVDH